MADIPDTIVLKRHRDLAGRRKSNRYRRGALAMLAAFLLAGLLNVFGQRPGGTTVNGGPASLELYAPSHLRGGLIYEARFTISAHEDVKNALLKLSPGWNEGQTMNQIEPSPLGQASRNGDLLLTLGHIPPGQKYRLFLEFQVNPTNVGRRTADVTLYDGAAELVHLHRVVTFFP